MHKMVLVAAGALCSGILGWAGALRAEDGRAGTSIAETAAKAVTSDTCFNRGFYNKDTTIDYEMKVSGDGATPPRRIVTTVTGTKKFNGVLATETVAEFYGDDGSLAGTTDNYTTIENGALLFHGQKSDGAQQIVEPAVRQPIAMKVNENFAQKYTARTTYDDGRKEKTKEKQTYTFDGLETVNSAIGTFKACRFRTKTTSKVGSITSTVNRTDWVISEGKYRGFTVKTKVFGKYSPGVTVSQIIDVTDINAFEIK